MSRVTPEMYLQMWLSEQIPADQWLEILATNRKVNELYEKEDGIYWLYTDNERKVEMVKEHIAKCKNVLKAITRDNEQIKGLVIQNHKAVGSLPKHSVFNPVSIRKSNGAVRIDNEDNIPLEYYIEKTESVLDKKRILKELREGKTIPGVSLITKPFVNGLKERKFE